ncbi:hypothetical protein CLU96_1889 [Chryseobacterium sp. 52]|uniref:hypothetical protein n=1 Tax=Chryseobacterium sp. 52 TaxID=2035213 RepID=UPI000C19035B|nr:hypothetical protein [Chryseobacterium sp. 52]PIF44893.1 hypothetical protein CLU96_1889 [Chryseobacterium sp. 52]
MSNKINELADSIYKTILESGATGKISDLLAGFADLKSVLKSELEKEYTRGYHTAKNEIKINKTLKQQNEN